MVDRDGASVKYRQATSPEAVPDPFRSRCRAVAKRSPRDRVDEHTNGDFSAGDLYCIAWPGAQLYGSSTPSPNRASWRG